MAAVFNDGSMNVTKFGQDPRDDDDPQETAEWLDALVGVAGHVGMDRARFLIQRQIEFMRMSGEYSPFSTATPYVNTIPLGKLTAMPGDQATEHKIRSYTRWNAIAMVLRAGRNTNVGGHIASFASAATLYDVGFNHFWHGASANHGGDLVFFQGHSSPGIYSRAFLEGRLTSAQLDNFRQETGGQGMPSYPHPWLMRDFWQFPTVSMGLGPLMAIYQARFMKYIEARGVVATQGRKVWAFLGDGEMDEPESLGAVGMAARERLDNLIFVVNCNLQRLDGPVRGNGKVIQELEGLFSGAGWNVIKVIWGSRWDALLARDHNGALMRRMMEVVDGEYQTYKSKSGAYVREKFFNTPELKGTGEGRKMSTTMAFVRILGVLLKDKALGKRVVPIVPDESRTFGMEGLFRQIGIWNQDGQRYEPEDLGQLMFYRESETGQILQEDINEAGGMSDWIAAATSYSTHGATMIPFFVFYSMFGFQRVGDLVWAAGDMRSRGFLLGGTAGRTTLNGEGLQHQDGHSLLWASSVANCISYDPTFSYELAVIMQDGLRRMVTEQEDVFYYVTVMNENYEHPPMPDREDVARDIIRGLYLFRRSTADSAIPRVQLMGAGTILNEVIAAAALLEADWSVAADLWSAPGITELAREGREIKRWNLLHPTEVQRVSHVEQCLSGAQGPVIASTDYVRTLTEQLREFIPQRFVVLGTDGFGRSDTREKLRDFFEIDRYWITVSALKGLADDGKIAASVVADAIRKYGLDPSKPNPMGV